MSWWDEDASYLRELAERYPEEAPRLSSIACDMEDAQPDATFLEELAGKARYQRGDDVVAFHHEINAKPDAVQQAARWMIECSGYQPTDDNEETTKETATHLFGTIQRSGGRPPVYYVHVQPPKDASAWAASGFQQELAVRTVFRIAKELR